MKKSKRLAKTSAEATARAPAKAWKWWPWTAALAGLYAVMEIYGPALHGPFVMDDLALPYMSPGIALQPFVAWINGLRPLLMLTFWVDYQRSGIEPFGYHLTNV